jgi:hypothetical protein
MKVYTSTYLLKDSHGNKAYAVCDDSSATVQICGLKDEKGNDLYFESEAYHLHSYFSDFKVEIKKIEASGDFDIMFNNA